MFGYDSVDEFLAVPRGDTIPDYDRDRVAGYREALIEANLSQNIFVVRPDAKEGAQALIEKRIPRFERLGKDDIS